MSKKIMRERDYEIRLRLPMDLAEIIKELALYEERSINNYITRALKDHVERLEGLLNDQKRG